MLINMLNKILVRERIYLKILKKQELQIILINMYQWQCLFFLEVMVRIKSIIYFRELRR